MIHDCKAPVTRHLVLVRHGQSVANRSGLFTGLLDSPLTEQGRMEAEAAGRRLAERSWRFSAAFTSTLTRAVVSGRLILDALGQPGLVPQRFAALDERDYGDLSGLDKIAADARWGRSGSRPGAAPTPRRRRTVRAFAIPSPASCHATSEPSSRRSWAETCSSLPTAIACGRLSWRLKT